MNETSDDGDPIPQQSGQSIAHEYHTIASHNHSEAMLFAKQFFVSSEHDPDSDSALSDKLSLSGLLGQIVLTRQLVP